MEVIPSSDPVPLSDVEITSLPDPGTVTSLEVLSDVGEVAGIPLLQQ